MEPKKKLYSDFDDISKYCSDPEVANFGEGVPNFKAPDIFWSNIQKVRKDEATLDRTQAANNFKSEIIKYFSGIWTNRKLDLDNIEAGNGADDLIAMLLRSLLQPGDEVLTFLPSYLYYYSTLDQMKVPVNKVTLHCKRGEITFSPQEFESAMNPKVKLILLNYPQNPTSKVFTMEELQFIRKIVLANPQVTVISDEVYLNLCFGKHPFISFATLPDMFERTISVYSVGKTFSGNVGKNKFGYAIGSRNLLDYVHKHNNIPVESQLPAEMLQNLADLLAEARQPYQGFDNFYLWNRDRFEKKAARITVAFRKLGYNVMDSEGGFYTLLDMTDQISKIPIKYFYDHPEQVPQGRAEETLNSFDEWRNLPKVERTPDYAFCFWLAENKKIVIWPLSGFSDYQFKHIPVLQRQETNVCRISFTRDEQEILKLENLKESQHNQ